MINAVIIDDEPNCIEYLQRLLKHKAPDRIRLLGAFENVAQGIAGISALKPELLFLDVQLGEQTGFDLLRQIDPTSISVIFTTAYNQYALQAFKFSAIDYLLKPIDGEELMASLQKVTDNLNKKEASMRYDILLQHLNRIPDTLAKIALPSLQGWDFIAVADIVRCQAQSNYTLFVLQGGKQLLVSQTLKGFEQLLEGRGFFRVHHAHLINLSQVRHYHKNGYVTLADGTTIEVATRRRDAFLQKMTLRHT